MFEVSDLSDESGSISWTSSQECSVTVNPNLKTALGKTPHRRKRNIRKVNKLSLIMREKSPVLTSNRIEKKFPPKKCDSKDESLERGHLEPTSPILSSTCTPKRKKSKQKYLFTTELSPLTRLSTLISPEKQTKTTDNFTVTPTSPVIMKKRSGIIVTANNVKKMKSNYDVRLNARNDLQANINDIIKPQHNIENLIAEDENCKNSFNDNYVQLRDEKTSLHENIYEKMFNDRTRIEDRNKRIDLSSSDIVIRNRQNQIKLGPVGTANLDMCNYKINDILHSPIRAKDRTRKDNNQTGIKSEQTSPILSNINHSLLQIIRDDNSKTILNVANAELKEIKPSTLSIDRSLSPVLPITRQPSLISPPDERIVKKIKSYFNSHLSSDGNTQASISDITQTTEQKKCTPIDITELSSPLPSQASEVKIITEISASPKTLSENSVTIKSEAEETTVRRRRKYKKNGLAGRLQVLIKRQRNQIFLWRHEMYLAKNSDFVAPNQNVFEMFAIAKINAEYSNYVIEAVSCRDQKNYLIILNIHYDCNVTVSEKSFLKVYCPYETMVCDFGTVVYNVCKFDCINESKPV